MTVAAALLDERKCIWVSTQLCIFCKWGRVMLQFGLKSNGMAQFRSKPWMTSVNSALCRLTSYQEENVRCMVQGESSLYIRNFFLPLAFMSHLTLTSGTHSLATNVGQVFYTAYYLLTGVMPWWKPDQKAASCEESHHSCALAISRCRHGWIQ